MDAIEALRARIPEHSKDIHHNLEKVLRDTVLSPAQLWGTLLASAIASRHRELVEAVLIDAQSASITPATLEDARAAASLMAMTNVYYRFKHFMADAEIEAMPARLRMKRSAKLAGDKLDYEMFCVAVSAIHGCEVCVRHHGKAVVAGSSKQHLSDVVRVASVIFATALATSE